MSERAPLPFPLILLCGGRSSRMGAPKGLVDFRGRPWLVEQLARAARAGVPRTLVVLGFSADAYRAALGSVDPEWVVNPDPARGQFSSLQTGIAALRPEDAGAFVLPVDVPAAEADVWARLAAALAETGRDAALPTYDGRGGHPLALSRRFLDRLGALPPTGRLDTAIHALPPGALARVPVTDSAVRRNLNDRTAFLAHAARSRGEP